MSHRYESLTECQSQNGLTGNTCIWNISGYTGKTIFKSVDPLAENESKI